MLKVIEQFGGEIAILNMTILVFMFFFIATLLKNNNLSCLVYDIAAGDLFNIKNYKFLKRHIKLRCLFICLMCFLLLF